MQPIDASRYYTVAGYARQHNVNTRELPPNWAYAIAIRAGDACHRKGYPIRKEGDRNTYPQGILEVIFSAYQKQAIHE